MPAWAEAPAAAPEAAATEAPPAAAPAPSVTLKPTWDQAGNIREAAERLGKLQRQRGAKGAYDFIAACYKTHALAEAYSAAFESCIAQDYMQTQVLAQIYSRMSPEQLQNLRSPSAPELAEAMGRRVVAAFSQYKIPVAYAGDFKKLVDQHGFPVFLALVFPNSQVPTAPSAGGIDDPPLRDSKPTDQP